MPAIKLQQFGGMLPAWDPKLLPEGQSPLSYNAYLFSGALTGWREPKLLRQLNNSAAQYVFRIPASSVNADGVTTFNTTITDPGSTWLEFNDPDTKVCRSQVVNDIFNRYYVASPSQGPPTYNTFARITNNQNFFDLGLNAPACAPIVSVAGGGDEATLGPTTSNGGTLTIFANTVYLLPIVPSAALTIDDVQWMPATTDPNVHFAAVLYADKGTGGSEASAPGALLGVGGITTGITAGTLADSQFTNPLGLDANTPYWIGICIDTTEGVAQGDGYNNSVTFTNTFSNGPPGFAPGVSVGAPDLQMYADLTTSATVEARTYVYTWVSAYGEESPPSPPTLLNGWANGTWTIGLYNPPANYMGNSGIANVAFVRLYRTVTASGGSTTYYFVADISVGSTDPDAINAVANDPAVNGVGCLPPSATYVDTQPDSTVALNLVMPSTNYFPPPANLQGLIAMPNGMYAGFVGNQVWFSVPYLPHAWPPGYVYTTTYPIVGLGFTQGSLVACTASTPWVLTGVNPATMTVVECKDPNPCLSQGGIVSNDAGVFYPAPNGLIQVTPPSTATNITEPWVTREKWAALTPSEGQYIRAIPLAGLYFAFGTVSPFYVTPTDASMAQQGFNIDLSPLDNSSFSIWPQPGGHRVGWQQMNAPNGFNVVNVLFDIWTSFGLLIQNGAVYWYDWADPQPTMQPYDWTSKVYQQNTKRSFEAMKVYFIVPPGTPECNVVPRIEAGPTDPEWNALSATQWGIVKVYADVDDGDGDGSMMLVCCREIRVSGELLRLPSGFKCANWQWEILGRVTISNIKVATSAKELANV
jgi:hypothetical protein